MPMANFEITNEMRDRINELPKGFTYRRIFEIGLEESERQLAEAANAPESPSTDAQDGGSAQKGS
jgi:hypothetical protein